MARHAPAGDRSFTLSLLRHLGAAVALVALVAAAFWGVGRIGVEDPSAPLAASTTGAEAPDPSGAPTPDATGDVTNAPSPTPPSEAPTEMTTEVTTDAATEAPTGVTAEATPPVAPGEISVQVLDAVLDDDGATMARVADRLAADGYRVVARNQAIRRYDVTTVMYTPGNEAKARQVAAAYGYDRVEPQPGNLSNAVDLHLVVGADA